MAINPEIKDIVYIKGNYVNDYYLTEEKNKIINEITGKLTTEIENRQIADNEIKNSISTQNTNTVAKFKLIENSITGETDRAIAKENSIIDTINSNTNNLYTKINDEKKSLEIADIQIKSDLNIIDNKHTTNLNEFKTFASSTYETKVAVNNLNQELNLKIDTVKSDLLAEISAQVEGTNKWVPNSPVENKDALDLLDLDDAFNWLCKVADTGYTWQRIAGQTTWVQYSTNIDYIDQTGLTNAIASHNISTTAHSDIRNEVSTLRDTVNNLSDITTLNLTGITDRLDTAESKLVNHSTELNNHSSSIAINSGKIESCLYDIESIDTNLRDNYVKKVYVYDELQGKTVEKVLSTNDFTNELKIKLENINENDYEKISNKVDEISDSTTDTKYASIKGLKSYVSSEISKINLDTSNLLKLESNPQYVKSVTTFSNLYVKENITNSNLTMGLSVNSNGELVIDNETNTGTLKVNKLLTNNIDGITQNGVDINISTLKYKNTAYSIWDSTISNNDTTLATMTGVTDAINSAGFLSLKNITETLINHTPILTVTAHDTQPICIINQSNIDVKPGTELIVKFNVASSSYSKISYLQIDGNDYMIYQQSYAYDTPSNSLPSNSNIAYAPSVRWDEGDIVRFIYVSGFKTNTGSYGSGFIAIENITKNYYYGASNKAINAIYDEYDNRIYTTYATKSALSDIENNFTNYYNKTEIDNNFATKNYATDTTPGLVRVSYSNGVLNIYTTD